MTASARSIHFNRFAAALLLLVMTCLVALALPAVAHATTYYVSVTGNDTTGNGSLASPFATVQKAVDSAVNSGDVVSVGPGTFTGDVTMQRQGVSLYGAGASRTTLHGSGSTSVINADNMGVGDAISGFTITGGSATSGGGIECFDASPMIMNDNIAGNAAATNGGGIFCMSGSPTIVNCTIVGNTAGTSGGGFATAIGTSIVTNDTIAGNTAPATWGGGIYSDGFTQPITNCIVWGNISDDLRNCSATYSDISNALAGTGNKSADPDFVSAATGNYRLKVGSPCIDDASPTGAPPTDKDGVPRPQGNGFDMGAYEYHVLVSTTTKLSRPYQRQSQALAQARRHPHSHGRPGQGDHHHDAQGRRQVEERRLEDRVGQEGEVLLHLQAQVQRQVALCGYLRWVHRRQELDGLHVLEEQDKDGDGDKVGAKDRPCV